MPLHSFAEEIARFIFEIVSCFSASIFFFLLRVMKNVATSDAPAMPHPIGPARARRAFPAAIPPAATPPPNQASAALVAAAPDRAEIAVPVEAVPNVVATHIAAVGPIAAIAPPAPTPAAAPTAPFFAFSYTHKNNMQSDPLNKHLVLNTGHPFSVLVRSAGQEHLEGDKSYKKYMHGHFTPGGFCP